MKLETGQLVISAKGNLGVIIEIHEETRTCSLLWCSTGVVRYGFPCVQLRRYHASG